jgi:hypothetical protein
VVSANTVEMVGQMSLNALCLGMNALPLVIRARGEPESPAPLALGESTQRSPDRFGLLIMPFSRVLATNNTLFHRA